MSRPPRYQVIHWLDRLPGQCWMDLVMWALHWYPTESRWWRPWRPITDACRRDAAETGCCYCGKIGEDRPAGRRR